MIFCCLRPMLPSSAKDKSQSGCKIKSELWNLKYHATLPYTKLPALFWEQIRQQMGTLKLQALMLVNSTPKEMQLRGPHLGFLSPAQLSLLPPCPWAPVPLAEAAIVYLSNTCLGLGWGGAPGRQLAQHKWVWDNLMCPALQVEKLQQGPYPRVWAMENGMHSLFSGPQSPLWHLDSQEIWL